MLINHTININIIYQNLSPHFSRAKASMLSKTKNVVALISGFFASLGVTPFMNPAIPYLLWISFTPSLSREQMNPVPDCIFALTTSKGWDIIVAQHPERSPERNLSREGTPKEVFLLIMYSLQQIPANIPSFKQLGTSPFQKAFMPYCAQIVLIAARTLVCFLGPGTTNLVSRTLRGLMLAQLTILANPEAMKGVRENFSQNILKGRKQRIFPMEFLIIAGVSPFQNPLSPCWSETIFTQVVIFQQNLPVCLGVRMMAILRTQRGWNIPETMTPDANPIPVCIILFLEVECLVVLGMVYYYQHYPARTNFTQIFCSLDPIPSTSLHFHPETTAPTSPFISPRSSMRPAPFPLTF